MSTPLPGRLPTRFGGVERLGEGAEGGTWRALDGDAGGRAVVLKHVPRARAAQVRAAFRLLRRVSSPHLPVVHELLTDAAGDLWLVTGLVEGQPLGKGPVPVARALIEAAAIAHALQAIHEAGTHHGDLSPGNVLVTPAGGVVLTDFGQIGCLGCGTPGFLAPEVLAGGGGASGDIFALGALLCWRLFGAVPWRDPAAVIDALRRGPEAAIEVVTALAKAAGVTLPAGLETLLVHLLSPDPRARLADLRALPVHLRRLARGLQGVAGAGPGDRLPGLGDRSQEGRGEAELAPTWWLPARWPYRGAGLEELVGTLAGAGRPRLVAVAGPAGAGRGRVVEELIQSLQARAEGPVARVCAADRLGVALGGEHSAWLAAWIAGTPAEATVIGLPEAPAWPGELAEGLSEADQAARCAAVLAAAAAMAQVALVLPVDDLLAAALGRSAAAGGTIAVVRVAAWDRATLDDLLATVMEPPEERGAWTEALLTATGGWPGATVRAIAACARLGLVRPEPAAVASAASSAHGELGAGQARLVLTAHWSGDAGMRPAQAAHLFASDGHPLAWAVAAARRVLGAGVAALARAQLEDMARETGDAPLALAVDADAAPAIERWLMASATEVGGPWERDPAVPALVEWLLAGGAARVGAEARARVVAALLRAGQAGRALALAEVGPASPRCTLLGARALEQTGRAGAAIERLAPLLAETRPEAVHGAALGLRWRALADLGRAAEALAEARVQLGEPSEAGPRDRSDEGDVVGGAAGPRDRSEVGDVVGGEAGPRDRSEDGDVVGGEAGPRDRSEDGAGVSDMSRRAGEEGDAGGAEARLWAALAAMLCGEEGLAEGWLAQAAERVGGAARSVGLRARVDQLRGNLEHLRGRVDAAIAWYERAAGGFAAAGEAIGRTLLAANLAALAIVSGDVGRGLAHGRAALRGYLALGRVQALPELAVNLVQLLVRIGSFAEAQGLALLLRRLLAGGVGGPLAQARSRRVDAELAFAARLRGESVDVLAAFAGAAQALAEAGAAREAVESGLRACALARRSGRNELAARHLAAARAIGAGLNDGDLQVSLGLEGLALAAVTGGRESFAAACAELAALPRPGALVAQGRLELAWRYDQVITTTLGPADARRPALARRMQASWAALMAKTPALDRPAVRTALLAEAGERGAGRFELPGAVQARGGVGRALQGEVERAGVGRALQGEAERGGVGRALQGEAERGGVGRALQGEVERGGVGRALQGEAERGGVGRALQGEAERGEVGRALEERGGLQEFHGGPGAAQVHEEVVMAESNTREAEGLTGERRGSLADVLGDLSEGTVETGGARPAERGAGDRHERLIRIYRRLAREDDLQRLLAQVVDAVMDLCDAERGAVVVLAGAERLEVARELAGSAGVAFSRSIIARVLEQGAPVLSVDAVADDRFDGSRSISHLNLRSVLAVPLLHRGEAIGAVYVDHRLRRGAWGEDDLVQAEAFAELAALAIAHARTLAEQRTQAEALAAQGRELARLLEERELEVRGLREAVRAPSRRSYRGMIGGTPAIEQVFRLIDRLADSDVPVVIFGESGTGKELVARAIHEAGARKARAFIAENCGAIPEALLESVLFGHAKGAFTGAHRATPGLFEAADGGTIFLDEIGEMSPAMQTKLLRVLQEGEVRRVGDTAVRKIDVRVIAASNRDLEAMVAAGQFRKDLLYRIRVVKIELPPLRQRPDDLAPLIEHFLGRHDRQRRLTVSAAAMRALARYAWPGNIRELENEVQRWVALVEARVEPADLSPAIVNAGAEAGSDPDDLRLRPRLERLERELLEKAMGVAQGNQTKAATLLGLSRFGLQKKLRRLAGDAPPEEDEP
jgi:transcriptional regulator with GAF, ATPase, and Fis domain/tetratricopeptide (TPR) repeat protein